MSKHLESLYQNLLNGKLPHNLRIDAKTISQIG